MITWDISPDIIQLGPFTIRWYGVLFAASFVIGLKLMQYIFKKEKKSEKDLNDLFWYSIISTIVGARLGHCLFYNPIYYLSNPFELLKTWEGGLASHGAAVGILLAIYLYQRKKPDQTYLWVLDRIVIIAALAAIFIRTGNLINSEIIGQVTDMPWAFVFVKVDDLPRHPAQLYEALAYLGVFITLILTYIKTDGKFKDGLLSGLFITLVFGFRFFVEFVKENQTYFEKGMDLNMGQLLSIPLVLAGLAILWKTQFKSKN